MHGCACVSPWRKYKNSWRRCGSRARSLQVDSCGAERRAYVSGAPVTICYELIDKIEKVAAGITDNDAVKQMVIVGTFTEIVLHELAYAVFDVLQIPVWGRIDDAADRLAAFVMMQFPENVAHTAMVGSAEFFLLSRKTWTGVAFANTRSPDAQRFYNFLCIAYGGDTLDFGGWTQASDGQDPILPDYRAKQCAREYGQVREAFSLRIMPYVDADLLLQIKAAQWFPSRRAEQMTAKPNMLRRVRAGRSVATNVVGLAAALTLSTSSRVSGFGSSVQQYQTSSTAGYSNQNTYPPSPAAPAGSAGVSSTGTGQTFQANEFSTAPAQPHGNTSNNGAGYYNSGHYAGQYPWN